MTIITQLEMLPIDSSRRTAWRVSESPNPTVLGGVAKLTLMPPAACGCRCLKIAESYITHFWDKG